MSIYVHITRRPGPLVESPEAISEAEWRTCLLGEADFRAPTEADVEADDADAPPARITTAATQARPREGLDFVWTGHPDFPAVWFEWWAGQVEVRNADEPTIARMQSLAAKLNARVISETGEGFDAAGRSIGFVLDPDRPLRQAPKPPAAGRGRLSIFKRLLGGR